MRNTDLMNLESDVNLRKEQPLDLYNRVLFSVDQLTIGQKFELQLQESAYPLVRLIEAKFGDSVVCNVQSVGNGQWKMVVIKAGETINSSFQRIEKGEGCCGICGND